MPTRVQSLRIGLGIDAEASYNTASTNFICLPKIDTGITSPDALSESDASWIGKKDEFARSLFKTNVDVSNRISKYGSCEFLTYLLAYGLGNVSEATGTYTIKPADPGTTLQLPSFSLVEQLPEGGGTAIDNLYSGCVIDNFAINFQYGPGLRSVTTEMQYRGSGKVTTPSAITLPAVTADHHALASGMSMTINGVDYVAAATGLTGTFRWANSLLADQGYFIGSGLDSNGYAVRNRLEYGARRGELEFTVRLLHTSNEYANLKNLVTGAATIGFNYDSSHSVSLAFNKVGFTRIENTEVGGIVAVKVTCELIGDDTNGVVTATAKCGVTGIGQAA